MTIDGEPWFVAKDVCVAIGYSVKSNGQVNTTNAVRTLDAPEKATAQISSPMGLQTTTLVSESGLYRLIMRSDKPEARAFQDWVTKSVLPAIRKSGGYGMGEEKGRTGAISPTSPIIQGGWIYYIHVPLTAL